MEVIIYQIMSKPSQIPETNVALIRINLTGSSGLSEGEMSLLSWECDRRGITIDRLIEELAQKRAAELRLVQPIAA